MRVDKIFLDVINTKASHMVWPRGANAKSCETVFQLDDENVIDQEILEGEYMLRVGKECEIR